MACIPKAGAGDFTDTAAPGGADFVMAAFAPAGAMVVGATAGAVFAMRAFVAGAPSRDSSAGRFKPCDGLAALLGFGAGLLRSCACRELSFGMPLIRNLRPEAGSQSLESC